MIWRGRRQAREVPADRRLTRITTDVPRKQRQRSHIKSASLSYCSIDNSPSLPPSSPSPSYLGGEKGNPHRTVQQGSYGPSMDDVRVPTQQLAKASKSHDRVVTPVFVHLVALNLLFSPERLVNKMELSGGGRREGRREGRRGDGQISALSPGDLGSKKTSSSND